MSTSPEIQEETESSVFPALRSKVGGCAYAEDLILNALVSAVIVSRLKRYSKLGPRPWARLPDLYIPVGKFADVITHVKAAGLVEFRGSGPIPTRIRLTAAGEGWARAEGILPEQTAGKGEAATNESECSPALRGDQEIP